MPRLSNVKHEAFARKLANSMMSPYQKPKKIYETYMEVYPCKPNSARASAPVLLARNDVNERIHEIIAKFNPPEQLSKDIAKLRRARKTIFHNGQKVGTVPDNATRLESVALALRSLDVVSRETNSVNINNFNPSFIDLDHLNKVAGKLSQLSKRTVLDVNSSEESG